MNILQTFIRPNGAVETVEVEVDENYFTPPEQSPTLKDQVQVLSDTLDSLMTEILPALMGL